MFFFSAPIANSRRNRFIARRLYLERPAHAIQLLIGARAQECECGYFARGTGDRPPPLTKTSPQTTLQSRIAPGSRSMASSQTTESGAIETVRVDTSETAAGERPGPDAWWGNCTMPPARQGGAAGGASHKRAVFMVFISPR